MKDQVTQTTTIANMQQIIMETLQAEAALTLVNLENNTYKKNTTKSSA